MLACEDVDAGLGTLWYWIARTLMLRWQGGGNIQEAT
jgi:hypothetical protein